MRRILLTLVGTALICAVNAQNFPQSSPLARTYQVVGLTDIEVEYSSPGVNDRTIFGDLVPYNELWRTGANRATKLTSKGKFMFGDKEVEAGTYALFTIPMEKEIVVILNSVADQGGTGSYEEAKDAARVTVPFNTTGENVERMRFLIENTTSDGADLTFQWANRSFTVPITVFTEQQANENFKKAIAEFENEFSVYNEAANYYLSAGKLDLALENAKKSTELQEKFWNVHTLAKVHKALGDKASAMKAAERSKELAVAADYQAYIRLNDKLIAELKK